MRAEPLENVVIEEIDLSSVHHPELCQAEVHIQGSIDGFHEGDAVIVGPTLLSKLIVEGTVDGKDDTNNILILQIDNMATPTEKPVH